LTDTPVKFQWGWKTRPHFFNDDAIRITSPIDPTIGSLFQFGEPIEEPENVSWDMAFELTTQRPTLAPGVKWSQQPESNPDSDHPECFWGWAEPSARGLVGLLISEPGGPAFRILRDFPIVSDDWMCEDNRPITDIHWWGSYQGWNENTPPEVSPRRFHIGIWTDKPATEDEPWSHPNETVWELEVPRSDVRERPVGCDYYPERGVDRCFRYDLLIPEEHWFHQDPESATQIYWISIAAVYERADPVEYMWGWKTRPQFFNDDAVRIGLPEFPHIGSLFERGSPIEEPDGVSWDMAFELTTLRPTPVPGIKWDQPPQRNPESDEPDCYWGWDDKSAYGQDVIVADDWLCEDRRAITDVHWWGSFRDWNEEDPPAIVPEGFHIGIWTDVPSVPGTAEFSHPGKMIWDWKAENYKVEHVGCDFHTAVGNVESTYRWEVKIPRDLWFYQIPRPATNVYWISISAIYDSAADIPNPWGWLTREHFFNDDAVRIFDPTAPNIGDQFLNGAPIHLPANISWDMAFKLTTIPYDVSPPTIPDGIINANDLLHLFGQLRRGEMEMMYLFDFAHYWHSGPTGEPLKKESGSD